VQDEKHPFATINGALAAIVAFRGVNVGQRWRIIVRPGVYNEVSITTEPNVDIIGSGSTTQINTILVAQNGPSTIANAVIVSPSGGGVAVDATLIVHDVLWTFASSTAFLLGTGASVLTPIVQIRDSQIQVQGDPGNLASIVGDNGTGLSVFRADNIRFISTGASEPSIVTLVNAVGTSTVDIRNSLLEITPTLAVLPLDTFLYGGRSIVLEPPFDLVWSIENSVHNITNGNPGGALAVSITVVDFESTVVAAATPTQCLVHGCTFNFLAFSDTAVIRSAANLNFAPANFIQLLDNSWLGTTTLTGNPTSSVPSTYVPNALTGAGTVSVVQESVSPSGSLATTGGFQTGVTNVAGPSYPVSDSDTVISWAPTAPATLYLTANVLFTGKWITLFNRGTSTITINAVSGTASGVVVAAGGKGLFLSLDGTTWMVMI